VKDDGNHERETTMKKKSKVTAAPVDTEDDRNRARFEEERALLPNVIAAAKRNGLTTTALENRLENITRALRTRRGYYDWK
jgi:hypothetical protein